jgi:hypothetical protein
VGYYKDVGVAIVMRIWKMRKEKPKRTTGEHVGRKGINLCFSQQKSKMGVCM